MSIAEQTIVSRLEDMQRQNRELREHVRQLTASLGEAMRPMEDPRELWLAWDGDSIVVLNDEPGRGSVGELIYSTDAIEAIVDEKQCRKRYGIAPRPLQTVKVTVQVRIDEI